MTTLIECTQCESTCIVELEKVEDIICPNCGWWVEV